MSKISRNLATDADKAFWAAAERVAAEVRTWPDWKRAGINISDVRLRREPDPPATGGAAALNSESHSGHGR